MFLINILKISYIFGLFDGDIFNICEIKILNYLEYLILTGRYDPTVILVIKAWKFWALNGCFRFHN